MQERKGAVTLRGNPLTLVGDEIREGAPAPDVTLLDNDLKPVKLSDFRGKVLIVSSVPSLDTPVCDMETRRFNTEAAGLGGDVQVLTVSMDLPFAQKRWCGAAGVDKVKTLSDHREAAFGRAGQHPRFGPLTVGQLFGHLVDHDLEHLRQLEWTRAVVEGKVEPGLS